MGTEIIIVGELDGNYKRDCQVYAGGGYVLAFV
jgi:hypothetical protein